MLSSTENSRIQGLFKALRDFPVLFKADLIFKDSSRKPSKFKYFSHLCESCNPSEEPACETYTHYDNSNLIWHTVSRRVGEVIPWDHPRGEASRVIQWYGLIQEA